MPSAADGALDLHFDVNETIMLGDPAGGDTYEESLNKTLAKVAFVRPSDTAGRFGKWEWHDGSPLDPAARTAGMPPPPLLPDAWDPPAGCAAFYKVPSLKSAHAKSFAYAGSPGSIYAAEHEALREALRWPADVPRDPRLCTEDGYYTILPAFFHTLSSLHAGERPYSVVIRTFGEDLGRVAEALEAFAGGDHPLWRGQRFPALVLPASRIWRGRYTAGGRFTLQLVSLDEARDCDAAQARQAGGGSADGADDEHRVAATLQGGGGGDSGGDSGASAAPPHHMSAVQDDYCTWRDAGYSPAAGKPLWLTLSDEASAAPSSPIFFDDNIHNDANDSIVAVRVRLGASRPYAALSGELTVRLQGSVLRRTPTVLPIRNHGWFLEQIGLCDARLRDLRAGGAADSSLWGELRAAAAGEPSTF